jgi:hypothetical protein
MMLTLLSGVATTALAGSAVPVPDQSEQERMLTAIQRYASEYVANLPNFICEQVTYQFEAGRQPKHWRKGDVLISKLVFNQGREERKLELVNNKPVRPGLRPWRAPLTSEGEFGMLIEMVFSSSSATKYKWNCWNTFDGHRVAVFDYSIDGVHSTLSLSLSDLAKARIAYHGSIYADPLSGVIRQISSAADDIPAAVMTRSLETVISYAEVEIGGTKYLLPTGATVSIVTDSSHIRNKIEFFNYRKFEADSHITFASETPAEGKSGPDR